ncbi:hypothetical protein CDIK_1025 [Cucumispora dikerogammari]|nr:hypothetical protein CDIK_1025 [Cucumispora dikerogammari]
MLVKLFLMFNKCSSNVFDSVKILQQPCIIVRHLEYTKDFSGEEKYISFKSKTIETIIDFGKFVDLSKYNVLEKPAIFIFDTIKRKRNRHFYLSNTERPAKSLSSIETKLSVDIKMNQVTFSLLPNTKTRKNLLISYL